MKHLWRSASRPVYVPLFDTAEGLYRSFSASGRALFLFFAGLLIVSVGGLIYILNGSLLMATPGYGGSISEGIVGSPRFINPILALSDADRDLATLVYSGLLRATPDGDYLPDLAESYDISDDGRTYTFVLRKDATFHDGSPVTADDVVFTIAKTQDPVIKSPVRANWDGIAVEKVDDYTVRFGLKSAYSPFVENMTLGILPKHLWQGVSGEEFPFSVLNTSPVGSGPFKINTIARTPAGIPSSYNLSSFKKYALGEPYLARLTLRFYQNEESVVSALRAGEIEAASELSPSSLEKLRSFNIIRSPLNRVFGVFFNQNQSEVLRDITVRQALQMAVDRDSLVVEVLGGYGASLEGPVPPNILAGRGISTAASTDMSNQVADGEDRALLAQKFLISKGWELGGDGVLSKTTGTGKKAQTTRLAFAFSTGNVPELRAAAEFVHAAWARMGADVDVQIYDQGDLSQNVIRPRKYDALFFGEVVGRELDLFAFWHSSQRNDPGLNIALYANSTADSALEDLRKTADQDARAVLYKKFEAELAKDIPAIFLYAPDFVYTIPQDVYGLNVGFIGTPSDRFLSVQSWHRETDYVWPLFTNR